MESNVIRAVVTVRLYSVERKKTGQKWMLQLRIYPVLKNGKYTTVKENLNCSVSTPIWDKKRSIGKDKRDGHKYDVRRDVNGIIMCSSKEDKATCIYADKIRIKRQNEYDRMAEQYGNINSVSVSRYPSADFIEYFHQCADNRYPRYSKDTRDLWHHVAEIVSDYAHRKPLPFSCLDLNFVEGFRNYVQKRKDKRFIRGNKISLSTAATYFMLFRAVLHRAYKEGYILEDLAAKTTAIPYEKPIQEILSLDELEKLKATPCDSSVLKRAAIFSALTGIRRSDLCLMKWEHLKETDNGWRVDFMQRKTHVVDYLPISEEAYNQCGTRGNTDDLVFPGLDNRNETGSKVLREWLNQAGIYTKLTFHSFRHTHASLLNENGVDIHTIKSMLGHTNVNITQNYIHPSHEILRNAIESIAIPSLHAKETTYEKE